LAVLSRFAWGPIATALDKREAGIRGDIAAAEQARLNAERMLKEHEQKLAHVQDEVREIMAEARRDADHTKQDIIATAQQEAEAARKRAVVEINRARDAALHELFDSMSAQVANATEHVLGRAVSDGDNKRLIEEALSQLRR
jgi:F-type H+-transporting ATPase subunit b